MIQRRIYFIRERDGAPVVAPVRDGLHNTSRGSRELNRVSLQEYRRLRNQHLQNFVLAVQPVAPPLPAAEAKPTLSAFTGLLRINPSLLRTKVKEITTHA